MSKGKNMNCVHKYVYNRSLEFEEEEKKREKKKVLLLFIIFFIYQTLSHIIKKQEWVYNCI